MAMFTMDIKNLNLLQKKFVGVADEFKLYAIQELDKAVVSMEIQAKQNASPGKLKRINPNSKYQRTGRLMNSISSSPYNNGKAVIRMGTNISYAPYVEFGTGNGYGLPYKASTNFKWKIDGIAHTYIGNNIRKYNMPARPFLFNVVNLKLNALFNNLNNYKPR